MALPTYALRVPSFVDGLQYPGGANVDDPAGWHTDVGGWIGTFHTIVPPAGTGDFTGHEFGAPVTIDRALWARRSEAWPADQWSCYQTIVPLDDAPCMLLGVRCSEGNGYYLGNSAYPSEEPPSWWFSLVRMVGGQTTVVAQFNYPPGGNPDGAFVILEAVGQNPVELRASVVLSPWGQPPTLYDVEDEGPHDFPAEAVGEPYVLGTYSDSSPQRILGGVPGFGGNFSNNAGGGYGFNAGRFLSASSTPLGGGSIRLSGSRATGATVTVSEVP